MSLHITTLCENTASKPDLLAEWGLSLFIQTETTTILFDTGASFAAVHNADRLGIDLSKIDIIVLSHGHVDHTGGLHEILKKTGDVKILAHQDIWDAKYVKRPNLEKEVFIGIPYVREKLENIGAHFVHAVEPFQINEDILTTGEVSMQTEYEAVENNLFRKNDGIFQQDPLADDLSLIIKTQYGLILILGCAHRGVVNIIRHAQNLIGDDRIYAIIGGIHLYLASPDRIQKTINELKSVQPQKIGVSHCTGFVSSMHIAQAFPDQFFVNNAGSHFVLG